MNQPLGIDEFEVGNLKTLLHLQPQDIWQARGLVKLFEWAMVKELRKSDYDYIAFILMSCRLHELYEWIHDATDSVPTALSEEQRPLLKRRMEPSKHLICFDLPPSSFEFWTHERVLGIEVGYDVDPSCLGFGTVEEFVRACCRLPDVTQLVKHVLDWITKLDLDLQQVYMQFQHIDGLYRPMLTDAGSQRGLRFLSRSVAGRGRTAVLAVNFDLDHLGLMCTEATPSSDGSDLGSDIVPRQLLAIKNTLERRWPCVHPFANSTLEEGGWIELIRDLWVDAYLETMGYTRSNKEACVEHLLDAMAKVGSRTPDIEAIVAVDRCWGRPMGLRQVLDLGLKLGLPLERGCSLERWYRRQLDLRYRQFSRTNSGASSWAALINMGRAKV